MKPGFGAEEKKRALGNMELLNISGLKNKSFQDLSGGQRQRVLLALSLIHILLREKMEEIVELRDKFIGSRRVGEENQQSFIHSFFKRNLLKGNPTMTSHKFYDTLEELKKSASEYRKGKK